MSILIPFFMIDATDFFPRLPPPYLILLDLTPPNWTWHDRYIAITISPCCHNIIDIFIITLIIVITIIHYYISRDLSSPYISQSDHINIPAPCAEHTRSKTSNHSSFLLQIFKLLPPDSKEKKKELKQPVGVKPSLEDVTAEFHRTCFNPPLSHV